MFNKFSKFLICVVCLTIASCSTFIGRKSDDYQVSNSIKATNLPDRFDRSTLGQKYAIPDAVNTRQRTGQLDSLRPNSELENNRVNLVKIQRLGSQTWILATLTTGEIWPRVNYFIQKLRIPTINVDSKSGIIETDLVQFTNDPLYHQFIILLEKGVQLNTTEVTIYHRSFEEAPARLPLDWKLESDSQSREAWLREAIANELAVTINDNNISLLGEVVGSRSRVSIVAAIDKEPYLLLQLSNERAFGSVAYSLQRDGFTIESQSRIEGSFSVAYLRASSNKNKARKRKNFFYRIFSFAKQSKAVTYNIQLSFSVDFTEVRIRDENNYQLSRDEAIRLLTIIRQNLT